MNARSSLLVLPVILAMAVGSLVADSKSFDGLKAIFEADGFKDVKVNLWRIAAGRTDSTHLVVIALPTQKRVAELIDAISDQALLKEWNVSAAKIRTTIHNGTYHEITK